MREEKIMSKKNLEPIILKAPVPLDDGGRKYNILYLLLGGGGLIAGFNAGLAGALILGLFGIMIAYTIKLAIVDWKWKDLRKLKFALGYKRNYDELIQELLPILTPLNMGIEKHKEGYPSVIYKNTFFDVIYNDDQSFTIWWRKSLIRAFAPKSALSYYSDAVKAMGIIGYYVQQECAAEKVVTTDDNKVEESREESAGKYCTECGQKCKETDMFCPNCGSKLR